jgi:hypothetical protein
VSHDQGGATDADDPRFRGPGTAVGDEPSDAAALDFLAAR